MSYDELLELGQDIGDVKQERWRIEGRAVVSSLRVITYKGKGATQGMHFHYPDWIGSSLLRR